MVFNSIAFLLFLPIVFFLYWAIPKKALFWRNALLLAASYFFYGWWDIRFLGLIILSSITDYALGRWLESEDRQVYRTGLLLLSLLVNLGILFVFKYFNFFIDSLELLGLPISTKTLSIVLPVGISFYTFQTLSYTIDVYRRQQAAEKNMLVFFTYVAFFPQLVAGPIERASHLLPQFRSVRPFSLPAATIGCRLILWGFFKKIVIADNLGLYVDHLYADPTAYGTLGVWLAAIGFGLQIYCDFSGYSDIAIGTARLFGFHLRQNFRTPYFASSIGEFWRRWHISLSTWFRDYLYFSMGGNRTSMAKWVRNIMITFLLSGLWHGANFQFLIWGGLHGLGLVAERLWRRPIPSWLNGLWMYLVILQGWIFFRSQDLGKALEMVRISFSWEPVNWGFLQGGPTDWYVLASLILFACLEWINKDGNFEEKIGSWTQVARWGLYYLLIFWIVLFGAFDRAPTFIYFQF